MREEKRGCRFEAQSVLHPWLPNLLARALQHPTAKKRIHRAEGRASVADPVFLQAHETTAPELSINHAGVELILVRHNATAPLVHPCDVAEEVPQHLDEGPALPLHKGV